MNEISGKELLKLIKHKGKYLLIDVRHRYEIELYGAIERARSIPLPELAEAFEMSSEDQEKNLGFSWKKEVPIIFYCRSGRRSETARQIAVEYGYNAVNYKGSILEWAQIDPRVRAY